jgi:hypothetical protein
MRRGLCASVLAMTMLLNPGLVWAQHGHAGGRRQGGSEGNGPRGERSRVIEGPRTVIVAPGTYRPAPVFVRPYYAFQPRTRLSFGLFLGYPVAYPGAYLYPSGYFSAYPYYPYAPPALTYYGSAPMPTYSYSTPMPTYPTTSNTITAAPGTQNLSPPPGVGGVSFDITPAEAAVFVDGVYVGPAGDFSSVNPPLSLAAGHHHFELRAQGRQTLTFDVDVVAGQVVPYQGTLQP